MLSKPDDVFDRDDEWADLADFTASDLPGLRIAIVYGRRRQGKSYLLRRLAEAAGGLYHLATEQTESIALRRFADSFATWLGQPTGALAFNDWEHALTYATRVMADRRHEGVGAPMLVLDEFPYLAHTTPGLPSIVQALYDEIGPGGTGGRTPLRLVLCGSAISVMADLLSGTKALRGRGALEMRVTPFGFRDARSYWGITDPNTAFTHNALIGGTPGYRELVPVPRIPEDPEGIGRWMVRNVLRPTVPLFDEANRVIHEDPRIRDTAVYSSLLAAVAAGESAPAKIGGLLGRPTSSLSYQLRMLESAGFIERRHDLLLDRRPAIAVADPVMRLHHLVIEPYLAELEAGRAADVWHDAQHTVKSKILGPHLEAIAAEWTVRYGRREAGLETGGAGPATLPCKEHRTSHEIDVLGLVRGARPRTAGAGVAFVAEAKARDRPPGIEQLRRLEHIRELLNRSGHDAADAPLGLFSANGFTDEVRAEALHRQDVLLIGMEHLYGDAPVERA
ncbi:AAA family ATPase [Allonocardiopsis opalescens]|uniref:ATPase domain-containing protein n=1 Tax=Allonocardiopsis opalescens TaxID=1144618 RepID=A0A2T0QCU8_9ACTN|nr:ATP-binding protein [Allonocardiopsis opalescens]PRY01722.1 hypothetical protein CLV72_101306 [Allonocardiopsis opalescens]